MQLIWHGYEYMQAWSTGADDHEWASQRCQVALVALHVHPTPQVLVFTLVSPYPLATALPSSALDSNLIDGRTTFVFSCTRLCTLDHLPQHPCHAMLTYPPLADLANNNSRRFARQHSRDSARPTSDVQFCFSWLNAGGIIHSLVHKVLRVIYWSKLKVRSFVTWGFSRHLRSAES